MFIFNVIVCLKCVTMKSWRLSCLLHYINGEKKEVRHRVHNPGGKMIPAFQAVDWIRITSNDSINDADWHQSKIDTGPFSALVLLFDSSNSRLIFRFMFFSYSANARHRFHRWECDINCIDFIKNRQHSTALWMATQESDETHPKRKRESNYTINKNTTLTHTDRPTKWISVSVVHIENK